jgi:hypothetical protein
MFYVSLKYFVSAVPLKIREDGNESSSLDFLTKFVKGAMSVLQFHKLLGPLPALSPFFC